MVRRETEDQTLCGQKLGKTCQKRRNEKRSKSGPWKNRSSIMLENCVVFTSLVPLKKNSRRLWKMRVESWNFRCQELCFAKPHGKSTGKLVALRKQKYACTVEADDSTRKRMEGTLHKGHEKHILQEEELIHWTITLLCTILFLCFNSGVGLNKGQKQKSGDRWSKEWGQNNTFCVVNGHPSSQELRVGASISKVQRSSCTPRRHCGRWFWILCSIYRARIISITDDGSKSNGCLSKATRMRRTSSWRSIC